MLKKIFLVLAALVILFLVVAATRPGDYRVTRSATIAAPPAAVFAQVNDFHKWEAWNPWGKIDPAMKITYDGPSAGKGAGYAWAGNKEVGEGRMTIIASQPNDLILINLEFFKPMAGLSLTEFAFKPEGNQTVATWTMTGKNNFIGKAVCMFMSMDKIIGGQFETGLAALKATAEGTPKP